MDRLRQEEKFNETNSNKLTQSIDAVLNYAQTNMTIGKETTAARSKPILGISDFKEPLFKLDDIEPERASKLARNKKKAEQWHMHYYLFAQQALREHYQSILVNYQKKEAKVDTDAESNSSIRSKLKRQKSLGWGKSPTLNEPIIKKGYATTHHNERITLLNSALDIPVDLEKDFSTYTYEMLNLARSINNMIEYLPDKIDVHPEFKIDIENEIKELQELLTEHSNIFKLFLCHLEANHNEFWRELANKLASSHVYSKFIGRKYKDTWEKICEIAPPKSKKNKKGKVGKAGKNKSGLFVTASTGEAKLKDKNASPRESARPRSLSFSTPANPI